MAIAMKKPVAIAIAAGIALAGTAAGPMTMPAAQAQQTNASTIDNSRTGSLTINKRANPESLGTPTGEAEQTPAGEALPGAGFTLTKVTNADLTTNAGLAAAAQLTPATATKGDVVGTETTNAQGQIVWNDLPVGVYLVEETQPVEGFSPAAPFLVFLPMTSDNAAQGGTTWNYDIVAYPKNYGQEEPVKVVDDSGQNVGDTVKYTITTTARTLATGQERTVYRIEDNLDSALTVTADDVVVTTPGFEKGTDYTVVTERDGDNNHVVIDFTTAGLAKIANGQEIAADITATVINKSEDGIIPNQGRLFENDPVSGQEVEKPTNEVETRYAGIQFKKVGSERNALQGAEFQVYGAAEGQTCEAAVENEQALQTVNNTTTFTSAQDGTVTIDGLHVNDYADNTQGTQNEWTAYCLVETKSPSGFELLSKPIQFTLTSAQAGSLQPITVGDNAGEVVNLKDTTVRLPNTGGAGIVLLVLAGLVLVGGGAFVARRNSAA